MADLDISACGKINAPTGVDALSVRGRIVQRLRRNDPTWQSIPQNNITFLSRRACAQPAAIHRPNRGACDAPSVSRRAELLPVAARLDYETRGFVRLVDTVKRAVKSCARTAYRSRLRACGCLSASEQNWASACNVGKMHLPGLGFVNTTVKTTRTAVGNFVKRDWLRASATSAGFLMRAGKHPVMTAACGIGLTQKIRGAQPLRCSVVAVPAAASPVFIFLILITLTMTATRIGKAAARLIVFAGRYCAELRLSLNTNYCAGIAI